MDFHLDRHGREFYRLTITTDPPAAPEDWEASFDKGETWLPVTVVDGLPSWLIEGTDAPPPVAGTVLRASVLPLLRLADAPEFVVRNAPRIQVS